MPSIKVEFTNSRGQQLAAALEMPETRPEFYAVFAHCFTCSKDIIAATRISRRLCDNGVAVLRFDFTGLGNSDGDFANTNFSSNLEDIVSAVHWLEQEHGPARLLIGHSLGGAAVLAAAQDLPQIGAIVTIAAPATAGHVQHLFESHREQIVENDEAEVNLAGRHFRIRKQLLDDLEQYNTVEHIAELDRPLLIFHSPVDSIVPIDEAARIYKAARHPKSFISLDNADHLLSDRTDADYVADMIASWVSRYLQIDTGDDGTVSSGPSLEHGEVLIRERDRAFTRDIYAENHRLVGDEPVSYGGRDLGPNPYEFLLSALGSCTSMTIRMYANRKNIPLENIEIKLTHSRIHGEDCQECESHEGMIDVIKKEIWLEGALNDEQRGRLLEIADKCPVHKTLLNEMLIKTELQN